MTRFNLALKSECASLLLAKLHPKGGRFTKTVNVGDQNVRLEVGRANTDSTSKQVFWRLNDSNTVSSGSFSHTISGPVSNANEGVYEAYFDGERDLGQHAIMRLIVRGNVVYLSTFISIV